MRTCDQNLRFFLFQVCKRKVSPSGSENSSEASVRVHGSVDEDVPQSAEDNPLTTEDEAEDGEQGNGRADEEEEQRVDEETTPLILRGDDDGKINHIVKELSL